LAELRLADAARNGWFPIVFRVVFGALLWSGLLLRDLRLRAVLLWNRS
jgi:hypothetical protein